ncbi:MAG: hypothetical protein US98_C0020G0005 [Parcubacteria group bacterium GW2011_GWC1_38_6]|nr:MAG: hypothetical protein US98_C0020G0005 [Parcubacteria group bacterium GW2011_GWC1_38_6]
MAKAQTFELDEMTIKIDQEACISCGTCVSFAPKTFELDKNSKSQVKEKPDQSKHKIMEAAQSCAVDAIIITDKKTAKKLWPK